MNGFRRRLLSSSLFKSPPKFELNERITQCSSIPELETLILNEPSSHFAHINIATAFHRLGKFRKQSNYRVEHNSQVPQLLLSLILQSKTFIRSRDVSSICHAIASGKLLSRLPSDLIRHFQPIHSFSSHDLSISLWSLAVLKQREDVLVSRIVHRLESFPEVLNNFPIQSLSLVIWSLATLREKPIRLFDLITKKILSENSLSQFSHQDLVYLLWSYAHLNHACKALVDAVCVEICSHRKQLNRFKSGDVVSMMHSMASLDVLDSPSVRDGFFQLEFPPNTVISDTDKKQLLRIQLAWRQINGDTPSVLLRQALEEMNKTPGLLTPSHHKEELRQASHALAEEIGLRLDMLINHQLPNGLQVDLYCPRKQVVIQIDGPGLYSRDGKHLLGTASFIHRLIRNSNCTLFSIHLDDFKKLPVLDKKKTLQDMYEHIDRTN